MGIMSTLYRLICSIWGFLLIASTLCYSGEIDTPRRYLDCGEVIQVNEIDGEVVYQTSNGNMFCFYGKGYSVGDFVITVMDNSGTPDVTDDFIVTARNVRFYV